MAFDRDRVIRVLQEHDWIVTSAARELGVSRQALYEAFRRHGITPPDRSEGVRAEAIRDLQRRGGHRGGLLGGRPRKTAAA